ncbi:MAG: Hsp20/alpha crystallin family protein [Candidatus Hydrothermales bacterium]
MKIRRGFTFHIVSMREEIPSRFLSPPTNVYETEDEWIIEVIIPGIERDSLKVIVQDNFLKVEAKKEQTEKMALCHHCLEWPYSDYKRTIEIPKDAEISQITTSYKNGILKIKLPKKTKKIIEIELK